MRAHAKYTNRAFTLIELLVVVAIIGLLSSVVMSSLSEARKKGRDAARISDMHQLQVALELYRTETGRYPDNPAGTACATCIEGASHADWVGSLPTISVIQYINPIPVDPTRKTNQGYRYRISDIPGPNDNMNSYSMMYRPEKAPTTWCSITVEPGFSGWNYSNGTDYPPCYQ